MFFLTILIFIHILFWPMTYVGFSVLNHVTCVWCVPVWSTCQRANVPMCQKHANVPIFTCQRVTKTSELANVPMACQSFNMVFQSRNGVPNFQLDAATCQNICQFFSLACQKVCYFLNFWILNFWIMLYICQFQNYVGNSRKYFPRNKKFKFWHLQNFIQEMQKKLCHRRGSHIFK